MRHNMKKLLIPAFACIAAMLTACGDDSSSSANDAAESSSSVAAESSSSNRTLEPVGDLVCVSAKDTTTMLWYVYEGADSALEVTKIEYPIEYEEAIEECEGPFAEKAKEQNVDCDSAIATINPPKTMNFDSFKALMTEECFDEKVINAVDLTDPNEAPENVNLWKMIKKAAETIESISNAIRGGIHHFIPIPDLLSPDWPKDSLIAGR